MRRFLSIMLVLTAFICGASAQSAKTMEKKILVAYFSATGTTEGVAKTLAAATGADLYRIAPKVAYTDADLDWHDKKSRSTIEMKDEKSRPEIADKNANVENYDVIFVGYPIWWYRAPRIINTFMESYNFNGKIVIPFATSGGSGIESTEKALRTQYADGIIWKNGKLLFNSKKVIEDWAKKVLAE